MTSPNENYTSWHAGMKVVCIADAELIAKRGAKYPAKYPRYNGVYTIREICVAEENGALVLLLTEIDNANVIGMSGAGWRFDREPGFNVKYFRPAQTRKTDISVFERILSNPHKKIHKVEGERV